MLYYHFKILSYFRIKGDLNGDYIQLILKKYKSYFVTYEVPPHTYSIREISELVYTMEDREGALQIE